MNSPGLIELFVIIFLFWILLGPKKVMEGARLLGKAYREFRGYGTGITSENTKIDETITNVDPNIVFNVGISPHIV